GDGEGTGGGRGGRGGGEDRGGGRRGGPSRRGCGPGQWGCRLGRTGGPGGRWPGRERMTAGTVTFVGAGPGAPDLLTLRGAAAIAAADVVIWASSLVHPGVLEHAPPRAEVVDSAEPPPEGVLPLYR